MDHTETDAISPSRHFPKPSADAPEEQPVAAVLPRPNPTATTPPTDRLAFVDVLRGLAILAVITVHVRFVFPDVPAVVRFVGGLGRYGVDLFFIVSAFTLVRSSQGLSLKAFLLRRWLRIAPVYYLGIVLYSWVLESSWTQPVTHGGEILANLAFINAWIPNASNSVVPGGWSISTEITFYALLPFALGFVTSLRRAIATFIVTLTASHLLLELLLRGMAGHWTAAEIADFKSYCPLGHLPTFVLGIVLYHLFPRLRMALTGAGRMPAPGVLIVGGLALLALLSFANLPGVVPRSLIAGVPLLLFSAGAALAWNDASSRSLAAIRWIGVISYGIYLIHFCLIDFSSWFVIALLPVGAPGMAAFLGTLALTTVLSVAAAYLIHRFIERPVLRLAPRTCRARHHSGMSSGRTGQV